MVKKWRLPIWVVIVFLSLGSVSYAKTANEYMDEAYSLMDQQRYDEALSLVVKGSDEYPGDLGLTIAYAEVQHLRKDYETAIVNYVSILRALTADHEGPELGPLHHRLVDAYNELGQKHYFPKELSLRIIYHAEKVCELVPGAAERSDQVEFERKTIGHYDTAGLGAKLMEEGGDGEEFQLPDDYVTDEEKLRYLKKAVQRIKDYDTAQKQSAFQTASSNRTVEDITALINQRVSAIKSIHFKRMNTVNGKSVLLEEIFYKAPDKFKVIAPDSISIVNGAVYHVLHPESKEILGKDTLEPDRLSFLRGVGLYSLNESSQNYNLAVEKIVGCPSFLRDVCGGSAMELYLITGKLKDTDKGPYPPTPTVEYFIDWNTGLCIAKREYWQGIIGSGKEEELAKEAIIGRIDTTAEGMPLASAGVTRGRVSELADLNENWEVTVLSINQDINDQEFALAE